MSTLSSLSPLSRLSSHMPTTPSPEPGNNSLPTSRRPRYHLLATIARCSRPPHPEHPPTTSQL
eukprot:10632527-Prorocentrum_lima.AAC.1